MVRRTGFYPRDELLDEPVPTGTCAGTPDGQASGELAQGQCSTQTGPESNDYSSFRWYCMIDTDRVVMERFDSNDCSGPVKDDPAYEMGHCVPGCTEESSSGCNSFRVSCEVPWTNCEDLSGTCVITEHSDSDWNGAVVTIAQSGCSATSTADKGKDEVVKAHWTVWPLAQGAGGAYTPLSGHSGGDHWTGSRDPASNQPTIDIQGPSWQAKMVCGITFAYQYHGCYNHKAGGDTDGNFMDDRVRSVKSLDE
ncbi:MAG: hypothetical protein ACPIOQ_48245, partial [Promethearchaeia archaeon]